MAAFNFPNSPSTNDTHTENSVTWKWDGTVWKRQGVAGAQGAAGAQGHQGVQGAANATTINDNAATYVITGSSTANTLNAIDEFTYTEATGVMQCGRNGIIPTFQAGGTNTDIAVAAKGSGGLVYLKTNGTNRFEVAAAGDVKVTSGNLVIGTTGKGIDFSATTDANNGTYGGTKSDELLHDYEYGTWTPVLLFNGGTTGQVYAAQVGQYTKVGNMITIQARIDVTDKGSSTGNITMGGLPWLAKMQGPTIMIQGVAGYAYSGTQGFVVVGHANANHYWTEQNGGDGNSAGNAYLTHAAIQNGEYFLSGSYIVND